MSPARARRLEFTTLTSARGCRKRRKSSGSPPDRTYCHHPHPPTDTVNVSWRMFGIRIDTTSTRFRLDMAFAEGSAGPWDARGRETGTRSVAVAVAAAVAGQYLSGRFS